MKNLVFILILAFTIPFIGCRSNEKDKLVGVWNQIPFTDPEDMESTPYLNQWKFTAGTELIIERTKQETQEKDTMNFSYSIEGDKLRLFDGSSTMTGEYWVDVLDKKYLKMTKKKSSDGESAWVRYEFAKN